MPSNGLHPFLLIDQDGAIHEWRMCQCPQTGYIHFYFNVTTIKNALKGVNALKRATSISTYLIQAVSLCWLYCVNALKRATSISTTLEKLGKDTVKTVSMPSNGLHPFLLSIWRKQTHDARVSMPSNGLHPFLPNLKSNYAKLVNVSMPSNGLHPFLLLKNLVARPPKLVSMPSNGLHPFLRYPSATPVKSRLCRGILVNNSQNILISSIFALFFWLFNSALWYYDIMEKSNIIYPNFPPIK